MSIDLVIYAVLSTLVILFLINNLRLWVKLRKLRLKFLQDSLDKSLVIKNLSERLEGLSSKNVEKTDGFLKFISESRDWAFKYIEDVQAALAIFKDKVEPQLDYANKYGKLSVETAQTTILDEINSAYLELKKIMPEDDKRDNKTNLA